MAKIAIIVPIHNMEAYLGRCLDSLVNQTLKDIEIICIDDASTDGSYGIVMEYQRKDDRIKVLQYTENKTSSQARKDGVFMANSEYIMFADPDDSYELNACEELYERIKKEQADILNYGTNIISYNADPVKVLRKNTFMKPYIGRLEGKEVFEKCFIEEAYQFNIWNKIYSASLCKKAFSKIQDGPYPKAQDLYAYFLLAYYASSYIGIEEKYYNYSFGTGVTGRTKLSLEVFERYCTQVKVAEAIREFLENTGEFPRYVEVYESIQNKLLRECIFNWIEGVEKEDAGKAFDLLVKAWGAKEVLAYLAEHYKSKKRIIAQMVKGSECIQMPSSKKKTIGIYCSSDMIRFAPKTFEAFMEKIPGDNIILIVDKNCRVPESIGKRYIVETLAISKNRPYKKTKERLEQLEQIIKKHSLGTIIYQEPYCKFLLYDMLLYRMHGCPIIINMQDGCTRAFANMEAGITDMKEVLCLASMVTASSKEATELYMALGIEVVHAANPMPMIHVEKQEDKETIELVWTVDTLEDSQSVEEVLGMFAMLYQAEPRVRLVMAIKKAKAEEKALLKERVTEFELKKAVTVVTKPSFEDVFRKAKFHIITAKYAPFSEEVLISKKLGVPLLMYEIKDHAELFKQKGVLSFAAGDKKSMYRELIRLMSSAENYARVSEEARESYLERSNQLDFGWSAYLEEDRVPSFVSTKESNELLETMIYTFEQGVKIVQEQRKELQDARQRESSYTEQLKQFTDLEVKYKKLKQQNKKLQARYDRVINGRTYKLLCKLYAIPRKLKKMIRK